MLDASRHFQTVDEVKRLLDLMAFHRACVAPNNLWIGVTGDINRADATAAIMATTTQSFSIIFGAVFI
jgi:hypothetical protein